LEILGSAPIGKNKKKKRCFEKKRKWYGHQGVRKQKLQWKHVGVVCNCGRKMRFGGKETKEGGQGRMRAILQERENYIPVSGGGNELGWANSKVRRVG